MSSTDDLANRAKRAYSDQRVKDEIRRRVDDERKAKKQAREEEKRIQDLQNSPGGRGARKAAERWFSEMRVRAVATVVTDQTHEGSDWYDNPSWGSGGYVYGNEWDITTVTWELEDHHYRGHYTEFRKQGRHPSNATEFKVFVKIVR